MNKFEINSLSKNNEGTGLANVVSYIFKNRLKENLVVFPLKDGKAKLKGEMILGWQEKTENGKKTTGYYAIDQNGKNLNAKTQKSFLPLVAASLINMGMDNPTEDTSHKPSKLMEVDVLGDDLQIDFIDTPVEERPKRKINYKLGTIEILNKLFSEGNELYWPLDEKYKKNSLDINKINNPGIKKVHLYKKLMGNVMIDHPFQKLTNFSISSSSFNVGADGNQPVIIEDDNGKFFEANQIRSKTFIEEGKLRINSLLGKLNKKTFEELSNLKLIKENNYNPEKVYNINLNGEGINKEETLPLVSSQIKSVPQEEIVSLVSEISHLAIKQTFYNKKEKELYAKLDLVLSYEKGKENEYIESLGIKKGRFNPSSDRSTDNTKIPEVKMVRKIEIEQLLTAAEKRAITAGYEKKLNVKLDKIVEINFVTKIDYDKELLKIVQDDISVIKKQLLEKRFKLNLIKSALFMNGLEMATTLDWDGETVEEATKSKKSFDGKNKLRTFSNKAKTKKIRVKIAKLNKAV